MKGRWVHLLCLGAILFSPFAWAGPSSSLLPVGAAAPREAKPAQDTPAAKVVDAREFRDRLKAAKGELAKIEASEGLDVGAPPGTPRPQLLRRHYLLIQLVRNYEFMLTQEERALEAHKRREELEKRISAGEGFKEQPPYSMLFVEDLRKKLQIAGQKVQGGEAQLALIAGRREGLESELGKAEEQQRLLQDQLERKSDAAENLSLVWRRDLAGLARRVAATGIAGLDTARKATEEELAAARKEFTSLEKQLEKASAQISFTPQDFEGIEKRVTERKRLLEGELEQAQSVDAAAQKALSAASDDLRNLRQSYAKRPASDAASARLALLERLVALRQVEAENGTMLVDSVQQLLDGVRLEGVFWEVYYSAEKSKDLARIKSLASRMKEYTDGLQLYERSAREQLKLAVNQTSEAESRLADIQDPAERKLIQGMIAAYEQRGKFILRTLAETIELRNFSERWQVQFSQQSKEQALKARTNYWLAEVRSFVVNVWTYEIFTVTDTIVVEGQTVTGRRSITVGKVMVALLILVFGYWASSLITRLGARVAVKRYGVSPNNAQLVRTWVLSVVVLFLVVFSLTSVKIPLTVFAFLGGAVAIGAGFGMQVLLKNLISGLMLLAERPFRLGDIVEVDGIRGTVTGIGIRSSTIRDINGIESLVPNSTFIEKNVTNWTYSSSHVRYSVKVGVAYGSPTETVSKLLQVAALNHDQILKDPPPQVLLEEFGNDALLYGLYFWLELAPGVDGRAVASELRTTINASLEEHGIVIAFPQRDVHLDTQRPLQVEVVGGVNPAGGGS